MADNTNNTPVLKRVIAHDPILVYEEQAGGKRILRSIRAPGLKPVDMPEDSCVTVEIGPDAVGSEQIADGSIQMQDLSDDVKAQMGGTSTYEEGEEQLVFIK